MLRVAIPAQLIQFLNTEVSAGAELAFPSLLMTHYSLSEVTTLTFPKAGALENAKSH